MKYCPFCGYMVENVYTFCPKCGKSIPDVRSGNLSGTKKTVQEAVLRNEPEPKKSPVPAEGKSEAKEIRKNENAEYRPAWKDETNSFLNEIDHNHPAWKSDAEAFLLELSEGKSFNGTGRDIRDSSFSENRFRASEQATKTQVQGSQQTEKEPEYRASEYKIPEYTPPEHKTAGFRSTSYPPFPEPSENYRSSEQRSSEYRPPETRSTIYEAKIIEQPAERVPASDDSGGFGWWLLSFLFPLAGLIIYLNRKNSKPGRAHSAASGALVMLIIVAIAAAAFMFGVMNGYISLI